MEAMNMQRIAPENQLVPKYYIVKMAILNQINSHELSPGDLIPSEKELMDRFSASRITVRKAMDLLAAEGFIYKIQGKGTFVADQSSLPKQENATRTGAVSCSESIRRQNMTPRRELLRKEVVPCPDDAAPGLALAPGAPVLRFERLYYADEMPAIFAQSLISLAALPGFEKYDLIGYSMMDIIREDYHLEASKAQAYLKAIVCDAAMAEALHVKSGFPLLEYAGVTQGSRDGDVQPIEHFRLCYRTDVIHLLPEIF